MTGDAFEARFRSVGMAPIGFSLADVGDVDLDHGYADGTDAIGDGDGGVGICSGIHHHPMILSIRFLKDVDKASFMVGLIVVDLYLGERSF